MKLSRDCISSSLADFEQATANADVPIALDIETNGLVPFIAEPLWISWATSESIGALPIMHRNPFISNSKDRITSVLTKLHQRKNSSVVWHNGTFDLSVLVAKGWIRLEEIDARSLFDTMLASYTLNPVKNNEGGRHSLKFIYREIKEHDDPEQPTFESVTQKKQFADIPFEDAKWYSAFDAWATLKLHNHFKSEFCRKENSDLEAYFRKVEMPHLLTTIEILTSGIGIKPQKDLSRDLWSITRLYGEYDKTLEKIYELAGRTFNFTSPGSLRSVFFRDAKIRPLGRGKKSGKFAIDKWTMADIFAEISKAETSGLKKQKTLIAWTLYAKLLLENIKKHEEFYEGRNPRTLKIHPQFRQTTSSGRYSCKSPNTLSMSTTSGIKAHLVPDENSAFVVADFGQIDLRVIANETAVIDRHSKMAKAVNDGVDLHLNTLAIVDREAKVLEIKKIHSKNNRLESYDKLNGKNIPLADNDDLSRTIEEIKKRRSSIAKPLNFGISYGLGAKGLLANLNNSEKFQELVFKQLNNSQLESDWLKKLSEQATANRTSYTLEEAETFLNTFHATYPEIPTFQERIEVDDFQRQGTTTNIFGRRSRAEGIPHLLSSSAILDVEIAPGDWYRVHCRGLLYNKQAYRCLVTQVHKLKVDPNDTETRILENVRPLFQLDLAQFDSAIAQLELKNICEEGWRDAVRFNVDNCMYGGEDFFERVKIDSPTIADIKLWEEPLAPFVRLAHQQIKFIQTGPLATFMRYPGYDALRRKLISYRVSSTSMDICKIAMIEFRKTALRFFTQGKLKSRPRIINCIHDEIAVECHHDDIDSVRTLLKEAMSFVSFDPQSYLAEGRELLVKIEADIGSSTESYAKAKPA